jgi:hypothetical protein
MEIEISGEKTPYTPAEIVNYGDAATLTSTAFGGTTDDGAGDNIYLS